VAALVAFMVWIYLSSLIILDGAEINSELSKMTTGSGANVDTGVAVEPSASL
jgi:uncharacterized BrkB/YihY/UPF0761 family membrane protein